LRQSLEDIENHAAAVQDMFDSLEALMLNIEDAFGAALEELDAQLAQMLAEMSATDLPAVKASIESVIASIQRVIDTLERAITIQTLISTMHPSHGPLTIDWNTELRFVRDALYTWGDFFTE